MSDFSGGDDMDLYVRERAAAPGTTLYYCTLFTSPAQARRSIALEAFQRELGTIVEQCREPAVAQARLGFWHEELHRLRDGQPQHPVSRVLAAAFRDTCELSERLAPALAATVAASQRESWSSEAELQDYCAATGGEVAALACGAAPITEDGDAASRRLGTLVCRQEMLCSLFAQPRRGTQALPAPLLREQGVQIADLFADPASDAADRLLRAEARRLRTALDDLLSGAPRTVDEGERLLRAQAAIGVATLGAVMRGGSTWLARHAAVSPLRKLWIAWLHRG